MARACLVLLAVLDLARALNLAPFSRPPHKNAAPLDETDCAILKQARVEGASRHAIFVDATDAPAGPGLVDTAKALLIATWHGVDRSELLADGFAFSSPSRVRGSRTLDTEAFVASCASLEVRDALFPGATPAIYSFAADPFDAATVTFLARAKRDRDAPPRLGSVSFDADDKVTALTLGRPLDDAQTAERDAPAPPPRRGAASRLRALFSRRPAAP